MSSSEIVIQAKDLGKSYLIYKRPQDRLKQSVIPRLQQLIGSPPRRYFHEFWALRNISFEVKKGETVGIIGRNGSGKSTLLQLICGTLTPTLGTVATRGRIAALLELGSGFNPEFSGRENVYLNGAILGLSKQEIDARFDDIAEFAEIGDFIEQPVKIYSSGMVVRLAFSVQAMVDPDIFIVDEALAVGDEKFQRKCFARLEELRNRGTSILFVSHSGQQIIQFCERALLLEHGARLMYTQPLQAVRAYQKLIYASAEVQKQLVQEYQKADQSNEPDPDIPTQEPAAAATVLRDPSHDYFDAGLVPTTTQIYPTQGAEIRAFRILDPEGYTVNLLEPGKDYLIEVSGRLLSEVKNVFFSVHIRSISGAVITGQRFPEEGRFIEHAKNGTDFQATFKFKMALLPGVYFVGGGVWSNQEPACLHRILDALMFRVLHTGPKNSFGLTNLESSLPTLELY